MLRKATRFWRPLRTHYSGPSMTAAASNASIPQVDRDEVARILATSVANGQMTTNDRSYSAQKVAQRTGVPQDEAEKRVDAAFADAQRAVEKARKAAALTGLVTVSALLISLAAAWYAAQRGGHNRDHNLWGGRPVIRRNDCAFVLKQSWLDWWRCRGSPIHPWAGA